MIKVELVYGEKTFHSLLMKGHAQTGEPGYDLVCAGVSACAYGALNALDDPDADYDIDPGETGSGYLSIKAKGPVSDHDLIVLETLIIQLKTIEQSYPRSLTIKERKQ